MNQAFQKFSILVHKFYDMGIVCLLKYQASETLTIHVDI